MIRLESSSNLLVPHAFTCQFPTNTPRVFHVESFQRGIHTVQKNEVFH